MEKLKEFETPKEAHSMPYQHAYDLRRKRFSADNFRFDTKTSCGLKEAKIIQLAAQTEWGANVFWSFVFSTKATHPSILSPVGAVTNFT